MLLVVGMELSGIFFYVLLCASGDILEWDGGVHEVGGGSSVSYGCVEVVVSSVSGDCVGVATWKVETMV